MIIEITIKENGIEPTRAFELDYDTAYNTDWVDVMQKFIDDVQDFTAK